MKKLFATALIILTMVVSSYAQGVYKAQYGIARTFSFKLYNTDGTLDVDEADGGSEVDIDCNGTTGTATNDFVDEGSFYSIAITAAEMACTPGITVDVGATDRNVFFIDTTPDGPDILAYQVIGATGNDAGAAGTDCTFHLSGQTAWADDANNGVSLRWFNDSTGAYYVYPVKDFQSTGDLIVADAQCPEAPEASVDYVEVFGTPLENLDVDSSGAVLIQGTLQTLDDLDTAQDTQHGITQTTLTNVESDVAVLQADSDIITGADGVNLLSATQTQIDDVENGVSAIGADTDELQTDLTDGGRLDLILDATLADTDELQTDWANGGRLDLLIDAILADTGELQTDWVDSGRLDLIVDAILADTNELQTDDIPTLIATVDGNVDSILTAINLLQFNQKNTEWTNHLIHFNEDDGTPALSLTDIVCEVALDGVAYSDVAGDGMSVTEIGYGTYALTISAAENNADEMALRCTSATAGTYVWEEFINTQQ